MDGITQMIDEVCVFLTNWLNYSFDVGGGGGGACRRGEEMCGCAGRQGSMWQGRGDPNMVNAQTKICNICSMGVEPLRN